MLFFCLLFSSPFPISWSPSCPLLFSIFLKDVLQKTSLRCLNQDVLTMFFSFFFLITTSHSLWDIYLSHLSLLGNLEHDSDAILFSSSFFSVERIFYIVFGAIPWDLCHSQIVEYFTKKRKTILELPSEQDNLWFWLILAYGSWWQNHVVDSGRF